MFHILGILFIILIAILILGLSIIGTVIRGIFGLGGRRQSGTYQSHYKPQSDSSEREAKPEESEIHPKHKKLFSKDEGEYVDFEEIKE